MKNKITFKALSVAIVTLLLGLTLYPTISLAAGHIRPVGKTTQQASQLVLWYDADDTTTERRTNIQVTNASVDTPVWVHVQIFASSNLTPGNSATAVLCAETDFNDFFTPNDSHIYVMGEVVRNDPLNSTFVAEFNNTKGFVVVTPIDAPGTRNAIAHQHMFGHSLIEESVGFDLGYGLAAMGRDAVSFSTGNVVADGTVLDGNANGYVLIQPQILKLNFDSLQFTTIDLVSIAFSDNYDGVFGYVAEPADATWTPLIFDEDENPISCNPLPQNCFFNIGLNDDLGPENTLLSEDIDLCPDNDFGTGWSKIAVSGLTGLENELGLVAYTASSSGGGSVWMYVE